MYACIGDLNYCRARRVRDVFILFFFFLNKPRESKTSYYDLHNDLVRQRKLYFRYPLLPMFCGYPGPNLVPGANTIQRV